MAAQSGQVVAGAAAPAAVGPAPPPARERRSRGGLQITDERLLWALQNAALGNDTWQMAKPAPQPKRPKSAASTDTAGSSLVNSGDALADKLRQQPAGAQIQPGLPAGGINGQQQQSQQQQRSQQGAPPAKASSNRDLPAPTRPAPAAAGPAPTKPAPAVEFALTTGGVRRPAKRIKAMLVADHYMAATLSDRCAQECQAGTSTWVSMCTAC